MGYKITGDCICCGACQSECPMEAIVEGSDVFAISKEQCTDCGFCLDACPVGAIVEIC